ncbi:helix-turn-helix domain-containing protein [Legionella israelensis]|uniref:DNA-binding protein n=1 Tax=Legionella israelensis TaxID=454 RepID=A0A0W0VH01_9GAMM|nr:helix-turn-helix domain-containing protein [Legionella israelensis]KTD19375.1 DNA-binding protein [Legionella israelensis]QBS08653.1 helix-turn-helix domain-containing protein [Legionella israelensis]SCY10133.1 cytoskeleton protein RodZ [Legionella israelensis DSM 19235]STX58317.1 DNA-binding protein [Legionella israelensis]
MNTTATTDESNEIFQQYPGAHLAEARQQKGYSQEYVAGKLHLRVRIIELLELDDYEQMPEPVFVKGYLRAYAKLLEIDPEPILEIYNSHHVTEKKLDKALWQSKRETNKAEHAIRWFTLFFAVGVVVAIGLWWQKNRDSQVYPTHLSKADIDESMNKSDTRVTDLTKMQSILSSDRQLAPVEKKSG